MSFNPTAGSISGASDVAMSNPANNDLLTYETSTAKWRNKVPVDSTTSSKGVVQLAGDLGGTAALPTVPGLAAKAADSAVVHNTGAETVAGVKTFSSTIGGSISGNAATVTTNANLTGDVTSSGNATTIAANAVTNAKAAQMATNTIKGNNTGGTANASDLTVTQTTAMLNVVVGDSGSGGTKGLVPAPAAGDAAALKYLKADGTWATVAGGADATTSSKGIVELAGDLGGTAVSPSVLKVRGVSISASAPSSGQVLIASSSSAAAWTTPTDGGVFTPVAKSTTYTANNYEFVVCNATSGGFTVTLPTAAAGAQVRVIKTDASANAVVVAGNANATLNGATTFSIPTRWESQDFASDGTNWYCI